MLAAWHAYAYARRRHAVRRAQARPSRDISIVRPRPIAAIFHVSKTLTLTGYRDIDIIIISIPGYLEMLSSRARDAAAAAAAAARASALPTLESASARGTVPQVLAQVLALAHPDMLATA